jgi:hypothetical protein
MEGGENEMELNHIYSGIPQNYQPSFSDERPVAVKGQIPGNNVQSEQKVDYDKLLMNLEEVKDFLYMLIGGLIEVKKEQNIGASIDKRV